MKKSPFGLSEWLINLKDRKLPVSSDSISRLRNQIKTPDETLDRMQRNIASEPMLAFAILNEANMVVAYKRNDIKSPIHAASMIGMNGLSKIFDKVAPYTRSRKESHQRAYWREVQISYEAASIARRWAIEKSASHADDVFWITFFRDAARWLLWFHAHEQMEQVTEQIHRGKGQIEAEQGVLGCSIDELSVKLYQEWKVPEIIIDSFFGEQTPTDEDLQHLAQLVHDQEQLPGFAEDKRITIIMNGPLILASCASKLAREANIIGWGSKNLPFYYRVMSAVIHARMGEVIQATHYACVEAANDYINDAKYPLACQLLSPALFTKTQAKPVSATKKITPLQALEQKLATITEPKARATLAMKAMLSLLKSSQPKIAVLRFSNNQNKLQPLLQYGFDLSLLKQIKWNSPSSVIDRLANKRVAVQLSEAKFSNTLTQLPQGAEKIFQPNGQLIMASSPLDADTTHIYWIHTSTQFNEQHYESVKRIVKLAN